MMILRYGIVLLLSVALWGCGKSNPAATTANGHAAKTNWKSATVHGGLDAGASQDMAGCMECHGKDFEGGISKVSCLNTAGCHGAGTHSPHPAGGWRTGLITHTLVKESNTAVCAICHTRGNNLQTPIITTYNSGAPGCFNSTLCHGVVGHNADNQPWSAPQNHGAATTGNRIGAKFSIQACQPCHATPSSGQNPVFTNPKTGMPGGCSTAGCHDQNVNLAHPYVWLPNRVAGITTSHTTAGDLSNSCGLCHGAALDGVGGIAPSCMGSPISGITCHSTSPAAASTGCTSCHGNPPAITIDKHTLHYSPANIPGLTCAACHGNSAPGQATHADGQKTLTFDAKFGEPGTVTYNSTTFVCSNASCHGGNTTPSWKTGTIANANCIACHTVIDNPGGINYDPANPLYRYINVFNGDRTAVTITDGSPNNLHGYHDGFGASALCIDCHNTTKLASLHFANLFLGKRAFPNAAGAADPKAKGFAAGTLGEGTTQITTYTYSATTGKSDCFTAVGCHSDAPRSWFR